MMGINDNDDNDEDAAPLPPQVPLTQDENHQPLDEVDVDVDGDVDVEPQPPPQQQQQQQQQQPQQHLGNFSSISSSMNLELEDDIALNESMLQSLHARMMELDAQIVEERRNLQQHEENIISLVEKQGFYRKTRDTNSALLREVAQSMDRCIQALKKKRTNVTGITGILRSENNNNNTQHQNNNQPVVVESGDGDVDVDVDMDGSNVAAAAADVCVGDENVDIEIVKEETEGERIFDTSDSNVKDEIILVPVGDTNTAELQMNHVNIPTGDGSNQQQQEEEEEATSTCTGTGTGTDTADKIDNEFYKPVALQDLKDIKFLEERWSQQSQSSQSLQPQSQSQPQPQPQPSSKMALFRKSEAISEAIYPLFAPHSSPELLRRMMMISQKENLMRREGMDAEELKSDYNQSIKGTILDIFTCAQYDPYLVRGREVAMGTANANANANANSNASDKSKVQMVEAEVDPPEPEQQSDIHKSQSQSQPESASASATYNTCIDIDANVIICRKALFGKCSDPSCEYQHLSGRANVKTRSKNKLRTVSLKTTKRAIHIELPIRNHPLPPAPPPPPSLRLRKDVSSVREEDEDYNSADMESEDLARNKDPTGGEEECTSEDMAPEELARKRDSPGDDSAYIHLDSSKRIKGAEHASVSVIDQKSTFGVENCDKQVNTIENKIEVKKENDFLEGTSFGEDDFISLPTIEDESSDSDDENNPSVFHISSALRMVLSECDTDESDGNDSGDESKDSLPHTDADGTVDNNLSSFSEALRCFGFFVDDSEAQAKNETPNAIFIHRNNLLEGYSTIGEKCPFVESSILMKSIVNGLRLSIHAGRVDVSSAIVGHCSYALIPEDIENKCNGGLKHHNIFITRLTKDLQSVAMGSFCGRGSLSPFSLFTVQLYLANCSSYIEAYISEISLHMDEATQRMKIKCLNSFLCKYPYKTLEQVLAYKDDSCGNNADKLSILQVEKDLEILTQGLVENPSPLDRLLLSLSFGQKFSRLFGISLCSSDQDPQLILETFLFSMLGLMKSFSKQLSRRISSKGEKKDISNSPQTKLQLVIFNAFGPLIFTIVSGIFQSMGCYHKESSSWDVTTELDSRNVGICVQVRQLLMEAIQQLDFSGITRESSFDGQLLLCPFFCVLSSLLVVGGSAQKSHVLLVNALYTAHSKNNWSLYSDLLWSSLIQLHIVYPNQSIITASPQHKIELAQRPLDYGVNPSLVMLEGDSALVQCLVELQHPPQKRGWKKRIKLNEKMICQLSSACVQLSCEKFGADFALNLESGRGRYAIKRLPMSLCLTAIKFRNVVLHACKLEDLPATFGHHFCFLKSLDLSKNSIKELPQSFSKLSNLRTLTLDNNKFEMVPEVIENLPKLERFSATNNRIKEMGVILNCTNLTSLNLSYNSIGVVPVDLPLRLPKLATLHLTGNLFGKETT